MAKNNIYINMVYGLLIRLNDKYFIKTKIYYLPIILPAQRSDFIHHIYLLV